MEGDPRAAVEPAARTVGGYEILRVIGRGGMATVYLACQTDLARDIALKELSLFDGPDPQLARRFLREARLAGSLSHPNIVTVHDYLEHDGCPYIAMEYIAGGSLRPYVGRMTLAQVGGVLQGLLGGLAHAEERGIVHRDLKPENLMVTSQGSVKIADFGIAKASSAAPTTANLTTTGTTLGTPRYMAPERAMGQEIGPWTDLFSVGVMVFELLVGRTPFHDTEAPMAILMRQINDPIPAVSSLVPEVGRALSDWIDRLLEKDPAARTRSASTAWREVDEILADLLGPRWLRDAPLPPRPGVPPAAVAPTTTATGPVDAFAPTVAPLTHRLPDRPARGGARRLRGLARIALIVGGVVAAAVVAATAGGPSGGSAAAITARNDDLAITAPAGWRRAGSATDVPLPLVDPITVAPGGDGGSVTAGVMPGETAGNVTLLPPAFLRSLGRPPGQVPPRRRVVLRGERVEAWRYDDLRAEGSGRPLTVYAVPTTAGVATVACVPPASGVNRFARRCSSVADSLRLRGAQAYRVGPSRRYAAALDGALVTLQRRARTAAGGPETAATQRAVAGEYDRAARSLEQVNLSPADQAANRRLIAALSTASAAYRDAAEGGDAAGAQVDEAQTAMDAALASLEAAGYGAGDGSSGQADADGESRPSDSDDDSGVGDSRSDDPSDDEPDEDDDGD